MLTALLLTSAAHAAPAIAVDITGVRDVSVGLDGASFTIVAEITRGKWPPVTLKGIDYTVELGGREVGGSTWEARTRLGVNDPTTITVPCRLDLGASAMAVLGGLADGDVTVQVKGAARASVLLFPWTFDFTSDVFRP